MSGKNSVINLSTYALLSKLLNNLLRKSDSVNVSPHLDREFMVVDIVRNKQLSYTGYVIYCRPTEVVIVQPEVAESERDTVDKFEFAIQRDIILIRLLTESGKCIEMIQHKRWNTTQAQFITWFLAGIEEAYKDVDPVVENWTVMATRDVSITKTSFLKSINSLIDVLIKLGVWMVNNVVDDARVVDSGTMYSNVVELTLRDGTTAIMDISKQWNHTKATVTVKFENKKDICINTILNRIEHNPSLHELISMHEACVFETARTYKQAVESLEAARKYMVEED